MSARGKQYIEEAEKALKKWGLFAGNSKYEDAAEAYQKAGNSFKTAKDWSQAGSSFLEAAKLQLRLKNEHEAATLYRDGARALKNIDSTAAVDAYTEAIMLETELGRHANAAKLHKEVAEAAEAEDNAELAWEHYKEAADLFAGEESMASANQCLEKHAMLSATHKKEYREAADLFERIASDCMSKGTLKFNAKSHLLNAGACVLAMGDPVACDRAYARFCDIDYSFSDSREGKLLKSCLDAVKSGDSAAFADAVYAYDQISRLDPFRTSLLLKAKQSMPGADSTGTGGGAGGAQDETLDLT
jgi:alpha-soluble NSF attachment protein